MSPQPENALGPVVRDLRARLSHLEAQQLGQFEDLAELKANVKVVQNDIGYMRVEIGAAAKSLLAMTETVNRWKGAFLIVVALCPLLGPLLAMLARWLIFGAPLSK